MPKLRFAGFELEAWETKPLSEVCLRITNGKANAEDHEEEGIYPLFDRSETVKKSQAYTFDGEVVILPGEGMRFQPRYYQGKFNLHQRAYALMQFQQNAKFVFHTLDYMKDEIARKAVKSTVLSLRLPIIKEFEIALPEAGEQEKIADCLSSLDACIGAETRKLDALKAHKQGLMQQLFPAEGQRLPRLRFAGFEGEWRSKPLGEVCEVLQGYGFPEVLQGKTSGKYPFCKVSDVSRAVANYGGLLSSAVNYVDDDELLKLRAKLIPKGATVFAKIGEALRLNRRAFVQEQCLIDNNVVGLKAVHGVADDYFVYLLSQLIDLNEHCGGAVPSVNKTTLEAIEVVVPEPDEQERIANCLRTLDDVVAAQSRKIAALRKHKQGLMQSLFPAMDAHAV
ncbi:MAG: restriction endonuclease subunit S [Pseudomonadota bacterium]|nr:restriction endonuclease subunit S [Pseudomonadota bacterium]